MIRKYFKPVENTSEDCLRPKKRRLSASATREQEKKTDGVVEVVKEDVLEAQTLLSEVANGEGEIEQVLTEQQVKAIEAKRLAALALREKSALLQLEKETMSPDWYRALKTEIEKPYFLNIKRALNKEYARKATVYPIPTEIYSFTKCSLENIKVVIIGQDPYHGPNQAHGLCFSVKKGVPPPPSLLNIFRELESDLGPEKFTRPSHGFLEGWCTEGVLLLNAGLTVRKGEANSHQNFGWAQFTDAIIAYLNKTKSGLVFMLWGAFAQKKGKGIDKKKHLVLTAKHPSPLSANQGGWFGCKHFSKANEWLKAKGIKEVDWNHLP
ncbi:hypothetical protein SpCBS45565_g00806 [Spizellomyces sp. 'palustris']|nr:hypothetical protein SpCBS45565_g00806 [Spizellomyces sp. 'palustris']